MNSDILNIDVKYKSDIYFQTSKLCFQRFKVNIINFFRFLEVTLETIVFLFLLHFFLCLNIVCFYLLVQLRQYLFFLLVLVYETLYLVVRFWCACCSVSFQLLEIIFVSTFFIAFSLYYCICWPWFLNSWCILINCRQLS